MDITPISDPSQNITPSRCSNGSFCHSSTEHLCPEEAAFRTLDDLLVNRLWWVIHNYGAFPVIDLCVDACVADEVDNPFLAFVMRETETGGEVPIVRISRLFSFPAHKGKIRWYLLDVDPLMDLAICLRDQMTS